MTNAETISKLNNALNTLINAYEELQDENKNLKNRINELEDEVLDLESAKENLELTKKDLEQKVSNLSENTQQDNSNISSMLGKIESLLNSSSDSNKEIELKPNENRSRDFDKSNDYSKDHHYFNKSSNDLDDIKLNDSATDKKDDDALNSFENLSIKVEEKKDESNENKIDLNRMASLLNGFNN